MCLGEDLLFLNLFGDLWVSCTWMAISLPRVGKLSAVMALNKFYVLFPSLSETPIIWICLFSMVPYSSLRLSSLFFHSSIFILLWLSNVQVSVFKLTDCFFCLIDPAVEATYWIFLFDSCMLKLQNSVLYCDFYFFVKLLFSISLSCPSVFSWISLSFLEMIILNYLFNNSQICISLGSFLF